jgi:hypothetical protein
MVVLIGVNLIEEEADQGNKKRRPFDRTPFSLIGISVNVDDYSSTKLGGTSTASMM